MADKKDSTMTDGSLPTLEKQRLYWNSWDLEYLATVDAPKAGQMDAAIELLRSLNLRQPRILEVGCGIGWLCQRLLEFGQVTGVDLADEAVAEARRRFPGATFVAADFCAAASPGTRFDVVVTLGTLAHVWDQARFMENIAASLKPGGYLIMFTQNRLVFSRRSDVAPLGDGQIRHWVTMRELRALAAPHFNIIRAFTIQPSGRLGFLRIVNSAKLNAVLSLVVPRTTLQSLKERAGLGQTLVMLAQQPQPGV